MRHIDINQSSYSCTAI